MLWYQFLQQLICSAHGRKWVASCKNRPQGVWHQLSYQKKAWHQPSTTSSFDMTFTIYVRNKFYSRYHVKRRLGYAGASQAFFFGRTTTKIPRRESRRACPVNFGNIWRRAIVKFNQMSSEAQKVFMYCQDLCLHDAAQLLKKLRLRCERTLHQGVRSSFQTVMNFIRCFSFIIVFSLKPQTLSVCILYS